MARLLGADAPLAIPSQYMVVFKAGDHAVTQRDEQVGWLKGKSHYFATEEDNKFISDFTIGTLVGYSAVLGPKALQHVLGDQHVDYVEVDQVVSSSGIK